MPRAVPDDYPVEQSDEQFTIFIAGVNPKWFAGVERNLYRFHRGLRPSARRTMAAPRAERAKPTQIPVRPVKTPQTSTQRFTEAQLTIAIQAANNRKQTSK